MDECRKTYAIIVAGGSGRRAGCDIPKQYVEIQGKPLLYYTVKAFEKSDADGILIIAGANYVDHVKKEIVEKNHLKKVIGVAAGGAERYDSVFYGLKILKDYIEKPHECSSEKKLSSGVVSESIIHKQNDQLSSVGVLIHDGARPFIKPEIINKITESLFYNSAVIAAMPVKDTIKIADDDNCIKGTTDRGHTWLAQTPQAFLMDEIYFAYSAMAKKGFTGSITDDAMVYSSAFPDRKVKMIEGGYDNIKVTTPDDLRLVSMLLDS